MWSRNTQKKSLFSFESKKQKEEDTTLFLKLNSRGGVLGREL